MWTMATMDEEDEGLVRPRRASGQKANPTRVSVTAKRKHCPFREVSGRWLFTTPGSGALSGISVGLCYWQILGTWPRLSQVGFDKWKSMLLN